MVLNHLAFGWEFTNRLTTYLKNGRDETEEVTQPCGLPDDKLRAGEWMSGSIQKTIHRGNKCLRGSTEKLSCACGFSSLKRLCNQKVMFNPDVFFMIIQNFHPLSCRSGQKIMRSQCLTTPLYNTYKCIDYSLYEI